MKQFYYPAKAVNVDFTHTRTQLGHNFLKQA